MVPAADSASIMKTVLLLSLLLPGLAAAPLTFAESVVAPGAKLEKLAGGFAFTEGPTCNKAGDVFFVDQPNNRILEWSNRREIIHVHAAVRTRQRNDV